MPNLTALDWFGLIVGIALTGLAGGWLIDQLLEALAFRRGERRAAALRRKQRMLQHERGESEDG